jgi:cellulose biosynthesis protein BcsQ
VLVIPVDCSSFALLGLNQLLQVTAAIREAHQPNMVIRALTTLFNRRQNLDKQIRRQVEEFFYGFPGMYSLAITSHCTSMSPSMYAALSNANCLT